MADRPYPEHCTAGNCPCISCPHADRRAAPAPGGEVNEKLLDAAKKALKYMCKSADLESGAVDELDAAIADAERAKP